jgi:hypothetical protein
MRGALLVVLETQWRACEAEGLVEAMLEATEGLHVFLIKRL